MENIAAFLLLKSFILLVVLDFALFKSFGLRLDLDWVLKIQECIWIVKYESPLIPARWRDQGLQEKIL